MASLPRRSTAIAPHEFRFAQDMVLHGTFKVWLGGSGLQVQLRVEGKQLEIIERREARLQRVSSTQLEASERGRAEQLCSFSGLARHPFLQNDIRYHAANIDR